MAAGGCTKAEGGHRRAWVIATAAIWTTLVFALAAPAVSASVHLERFDAGYTHQLVFEVGPSPSAKEVCLRPEEYGPPDWVWRPASPGCSVSLAIYQAGELLHEGTAYWYGGEEAWQAEESAKFRYGLSCQHTGQLRWAVLVSAEDGSGWTQESSNRVQVARCVPWHRVFMSPRTARGAVLKRLRGELVTSLRCNGSSWRWGTTRCTAIYSRSYRTCLGVFRTREEESSEFGWIQTERTAKLNRRRCVSF
jgi:hypothetical protein